MITDNPNFPKILMNGQEEIDILRDVVSIGECLGNGSSRLVMGYGDNKVVKIAFDSKGRTQNETEYDIWCQFGDKGFLAEVFALGQNIIIMERVEVYDEYEIEDAISYYYDVEDEEYDEETYGPIDEATIRFAEQIFDLRDELDNILGQTEDNLQIGITPDGLKSYDYGFMPENYENSVSRTLQGKIMKHGRIDIIELLIQELEWEHNFKTSWEGETILYETSNSQ